jgi:hypothetical protein
VPCSTGSLGLAASILSFGHLRSGYSYHSDINETVRQH